MKRPLTDHEYQVNNGTWIPCTLSNTTDNGDGTYTITDGLSIEIPIGSLKVRVKALGINPASAALLNTIAFNAPHVGDIPLFYINPVKTMAVGDADQLLSFVSSSPGPVTFTSSDTSKATIVVSGGNSYLRAIADGDVTIMADQTAGGGYTTASDNSLATIVIATTVDDITYSTLALGKAATADGNMFNVPDSTTYTLRKYLMVNGKAVYQTTIPSTVLTTAKAVKERIYSGVLGTMPGSPTVDIDSSFAAYHWNKFKIIGDTSVLDNNIAQYNRFSKVIEGGTLNITLSSDVVTQIDWVNAVGSGYAPGAIPLKGIYYPAGTWNVSMEIRLLPGDSGKSVFAGPALDGGGTSYVEWALTDADQTFALTIENTIDTDSNWGFILAAARTAAVSAITSLSIIVSNLRFTPGVTTAAPSQLIKDPTLTISSDYLPKGLKSDLSFKMKDAIKVNGNSLIHRDTTPIPIPSMSFMCAMNIPSVNPGGYNIMLAYENSSVITYFENDGYLRVPTNWFNNIAENSFHFFRDEWFILTVTTDGQFNDIYINGFKVMHTDKGSIQAVTSYSRLGILGDINNEFATWGKFSGFTLWRSKLNDADTLSAANLMKERMRLKNHFVDSSPYYYISEGDSITQVLGSYQRLLRDDFTPQLMGSSPAEGGAVLGTLGDVLPANSLFARQSWVNQSITDARAAGRKVVMTVLIGTNDMTTIMNNSSNTITYYNRLCSYVATARSLGAKVAMCTILDINHSGFMPEANRPYLVQLNDLIRSDNSKYDALIDFNIDPAFNIATTTYYNSDLVHPNPTGYAKMHDIAKPVLDNLLKM